MHELPHGLPLRHILQHAGWACGAGVGEMVGRASRFPRRQSHDGTLEPCQMPAFAVPAIATIEITHVEAGDRLADRAPPRPSSSMTDGTSDRSGILSIALQLIHGATEGPPGGPSPVFPAGDLPGLADDDARGLGRLFPRLRMGG